MKKGFTLIELLAVIVILAIIALIAVPIILNIIGDAKEQSNLRSAELYLDAAKKAIANYQIKNPTVDFKGTKNCSISSDKINCTGIGEIPVSVNGTKPTGGTIVLRDGKVAAGTTLNYTNETFTYNGSTITKSSNNNNNTNTDDIVCTNGFQTKSFGNSCTYQDLDSSNGITVGDKVTCGTEGFYVIETPQGDTVKMITEWNLNVTDPDAKTYHGISESQLYDCSTEGYQDFHVRGFEKDTEMDLEYMKQVTIEYRGSGSGSISYNGSGSGSGYITGYIPYGLVAFWSGRAKRAVDYVDYGYWINNLYDSLNSNFSQCTGDNCDVHNGIQYPVYVYGISNSNNGATATLTPFVTNYVNNLNSSLGTSATGRLISYDELTSLGCDRNSWSCSNAPSWLYQTSYWSGSASTDKKVYVVLLNGEIEESWPNDIGANGVRPVIEISRSVIE